LYRLEPLPGKGARLKPDAAANRTSGVFLAAAHD
jgi:hypothetical protein